MLQQVIMSHVIAVVYGHWECEYTIILANCTVIPHDSVYCNM